MKEFFGIGGYQRPAEGYMSWQHLLFVGTLMLLMVALAVIFGIRTRRRERKPHDKVMVITAIVLMAVEAFKYAVLGIKAGLENDPEWWTVNLPLFLCSIQLFTIPLAAFAKGRVQEASMDFVMIFGILGAVLGTIGAAQNYNAYPVLSFNNVISGLTHAIAGFASIYIMVSGRGSLKEENMLITYAILLGLCAIAFGANAWLDYNYMFLRTPDGTPYEILYNLVGGDPVGYPLGVIALFLVYITVFYGIHHIVLLHKKKQTVNV